MNNVAHLSLHTIEKSNTDCDQQYKEVVQRLDSLDSKLDRIEQLVTDIRINIFKLGI